MAWIDYYSKEIEMIDKYKSHKDYHWRDYYREKPTLYQKHVNKVIDFFKNKEGRLLDVGCG